MTSFRSLLVVSATVGGLGCASDLRDGRPVAVVLPSAEAAQPAPGAALVIDPGASVVRALGAKITGTHEVYFPSFAGELKLDGQTPTSIEVTVNMGALHTDNERLTGHLRSADFFDVDRFPTAGFRSTSLAAGSEVAGFTYTVTGDLTIHGKTKRVVFPATITLDGGAMKARSEFVIDRQDFGIAYPGMPDDLIRDDVALTIDLAS